MGGWAGMPKSAVLRMNITLSARLGAMAAPHSPHPAHCPGCFFGLPYSSRWGGSGAEAGGSQGTESIRVSENENPPVESNTVEPD